MSSYTDLKNKHQKEIDSFPLGFAFNKEQFVEMMRKWGLTENDTDKIYSLGVGCSYIRKSDSQAFHDLIERHRKEREDAMNADLTGEGYIYEMFAYELANHEYSYTWDLEETLDSLNLTRDEVIKNDRLRAGLKKAVSKYHSVAGGEW
jgi:hypothetical protein